MDIQKLRKGLLAFFEQQRDFVVEMTSEEMAPYFEEKTMALLFEMRRTVEFCRDVCERESSTLEEMRNAFDAFRQCLNRADEVALPWIERMRMPN